MAARRRTAASAFLACTLADDDGLPVHPDRPAAWLLPCIDGDALLCEECWRLFNEHVERGLGRRLTRQDKSRCASSVLRSRRPLAPSSLPAG